jgi:DNA repair photolyase
MDTKTEQTPTERAIKVFISYCRADSELAEQIAKLFADAGIEYFLDLKDVDWGMNIKETVDQGIAECSHLLVILSPASLRSNWVPYEIGFASALDLMVLPFLQHPAIDVPDYLRAVRSIKDLRELKDYFSDPRRPLSPYRVRRPIVVHQDHTHLPPRQESLTELQQLLRIFSTTGRSYFLDPEIRAVLRKKLQQGCRFKVLLLAPDSPFMADRQLQERQIFVEEQRESIANIKEFQLQFPGQIEVRFFKCAPTYQALIIDDQRAFVSIPVYGVAGTAAFPCVEVLNSIITEPVFDKFAESFNTLWRESGSYIYDLVAYHDSWISLDPIIGCSYDCKYCVLQLPRWTGKRPQRLFSPQEAVLRLIAHRYFVENRTVISVGNRTDPFLKSNVDLTLQVLHEFKSRGLRNPICLVTKSPIPEGAIRDIARLRFPRVIIFLSYSGLGHDLEVGVNHDALRRNFRQLSERGIPCVHFWRPILPTNSSEGQIRKMLGFVSEYASSSVVGGLKYCPELRELYKAEPALRIPDNAGLPPYGEWLAAGIERSLQNVLKDNFATYPIYRHTSCAVSKVLGIPDYNATVYRPDVCRASNCPEKQRKVCREGSRAPSEVEVSSWMNRLHLNLSFSLEENKLVVRNPISQEDYIFLLHNINFPIEARVVFTNVLHGSIFKGVEPWTGREGKRPCAARNR